MGLRARILRVTSQTGPRNKNVLRGLARGEKQRAQFDTIFKGMLDVGEIVKLSDRRQAKYGPPKQRGHTYYSRTGEITALVIGLVLISLGGACALGGLVLIWIGLQAFP